MVVDKRIELETKLLKDFPEWQFLSQDDLNRKTFEIYYDLHIAKRDCGKDQKIIKVPNPEVFKIAAPILVAKRHYKNRKLSNFNSFVNLLHDI